ncbi:hypothetical protein IT408_01480 [Candidatus Uhrbacteria bacterium]|nr:hypothetical protein [Candidatus Uhrbacteria bacterium]
MPFSLHDRKKCLVFAQTIKGLRSKSHTLILWEVFLQKAFIATRRGLFKDDDIHREMVESACAFKRSYAAVNYGDNERLRLMPHCITHIGCRMSIGSSQHAAARDLLETIEYDSSKLKDVVLMTSLPDSGKRVKNNTSQLSRRLIAMN